MPLTGLDNVKKAINEIPVRMNEQVKAVWIQGLSAVITSTPVHFKDGGRLRNNWFLTVGKPSNATRGKGRNGGDSTASLKTMPKSVLGKKIFFTNNLPYANVVEYGGYPNNPAQGTWTGAGYQKLSVNGYSRQAPNGMVRINMVRMRNKF